MTQAGNHVPPGLTGKIARLQGPVLVLGGSGFVGANLLRTLLRQRGDVFGTTTRLPAWRLEELPADRVKLVDLLIDSNLDGLLDAVKPRTIFNCVAYGGYSFETNSELIYQTNFTFVTRLLARLTKRSIACYVHAGSSSEYGDAAAGAEPRTPRWPPTATTPCPRSRGGQPDLLPRQTEQVAVCQSPPLFRLRPAGGFRAADPECRAPRPGRRIPGVRQPGHFPRFRPCR